MAELNDLIAKRNALDAQIAQARSAQGSNAITQGRDPSPAAWYRCDFSLNELAAVRLFPASAHSGRALRRLVAKMSDEDSLGLPPAVLNYEAGDPRQAPPPVRFIGYAKGVAIVGVGAQGAALARSVAPTIHAALTHRARCLIGVNERSGDISFKPMPMPLRYFIPSAVLSPSKGVGYWRRWIDEASKLGGSLVDVPDARMEMQRRIEAALVRQVNWLDPADESEDDENCKRTNWGLLTDEDDEIQMVARGSRPFTVTIHSCGQSFQESRINAETRALAVATGQGPVGSLPLVGVHHIEIGVNAELNGIWQVGRMTSSGYGLLIRSLRTELRAAS